MLSLEEEFHKAMIGIYEFQKDFGVYASYFKQMIDKYGGSGAAKRLLAKNEFQEGLIRLFEMEMLDHSMEALVLEPRFRELFTQEEIQEARRRLEELGYLDKDKINKR